MLYCTSTFTQCNSKYKLLDQSLSLNRVFVVVVVVLILPKTRTVPRSTSLQLLNSGQASLGNKLRKSSNGQNFNLFFADLFTSHDIHSLTFTVHSPLSLSVTLTFVLPFKATTGYILHKLSFPQ